MRNAKAQRTRKSAKNARGNAGLDGRLGSLPFWGEGGVGAAFGRRPLPRAPIPAFPQRGKEFALGCEATSRLLRR